MPIELDIYGVYVPGFFGLMMLAYIVSRVVRYVAGRAGLYAFVWHRALFDVAMYVLILGALFPITMKFVR